MTCRSSSDIHPAEVKLVDPGVQLVRIGIVDLAQPPAADDRLADLDVEARQFAGDRCTDVEVVEILACEGEAGFELGAGRPQLPELFFLQPRVGRLALERDGTAVLVIGQLVL